MSVWTMDNEQYLIEETIFSFSADLIFKSLGRFESDF